MNLVYTSLSSVLDIWRLVPIENVLIKKPFKY